MYNRKLSHISEEIDISYYEKTKQFEVLSQKIFYKISFGDLKKIETRTEKENFNLLNDFETVFQYVNALKAGDILIKPIGMNDEKKGFIRLYGHGGAFGTANIKSILLSLLTPEEQEQVIKNG